MTEKRLSITQLSEYLTASAARRKSIIADAADTKPFIANTYKAASTAITSSLLNPGTAVAKLHDAVKRLQKQLTGPSEPWQIQHMKHCIEALQKYEVMMPTMNLSSWQVSSPDGGPGFLNIAGIRITMSPEAILTRKVGNEIQVGALKIYYPKTKKLEQKRADYIGAGLHWYCEESLSDVGNAHHKCSLVADLTGGVMHTAPKAKVRNRSDLEAACEEIARLWPDD